MQDRAVSEARYDSELLEEGVHDSYKLKLKWHGLDPLPIPVRQAAM